MYHFVALVGIFLGLCHCLRKVDATAIIQIDSSTRACESHDGVWSPDSQGSRAQDSLDCRDIASG